MDNHSKYSTVIGGGFSSIPSENYSAIIPQNPNSATRIVIFEKEYKPILYTSHSSGSYSTAIGFNSAITTGTYNIALGNFSFFTQNTYLSKTNSSYTNYVTK